jgi:hypothetical protein
MNTAFAKAEKVVSGKPMCVAVTLQIECPTEERFVKFVYDDGAKIRAFPKLLRDWAEGHAFDGAFFAAKKVTSDFNITIKDIEGFGPSLEDWLDGVMVAARYAAWKATGYSPSERDQEHLYGWQLKEWGIVSPT